MSFLNLFFPYKGKVVRTSVRVGFGSQKPYWLKVGGIGLFLLVMHAYCYGQHILNGKVSDADGRPLAGASVQIKGSIEGTTCDLDGKFLIEIPSTSSILVISHKGYSTLEITAGEDRNKEFKLAIDEEQAKLDEVVIVGFGQQKKKTFTCAVSTISM